MHYYFCINMFECKCLFYKIVQFQDHLTDIVCLDHNLFIAAFACIPELKKMFVFNLSLEFLYNLVVFCFRLKGNVSYILLFVCEQKRCF